MGDPRTLSLTDYTGQELANLFWAADLPVGWLAVVLPGLGYTSDMPLLFFTRRMLLWRGVDVLNLNLATRSAAFQGVSEAEQLAWLTADVLAGIKAGLAQCEYRGLILAGKSIGSLAIAGAVEQAQNLLPTALVWLTPLLKWDVVFKAALSARGPQVYLCGNADSTFAPERLQQILSAKPQASAYVAKDANHSLEVPGNDRATFLGFSEAMLFLGKYLDAVLAPSTGNLA
ncbi:MAG: hypothetical protein ACYDHA_05390 [Bellilinea sp.]